MSQIKELLIYNGEITFDKIEDILTLFNQRMPETNSQVCKIRLFSIMVECLENAYRHNYTPPDQSPEIKIDLSQDESTFILSVGNKIANVELKPFTDRIDKLNELSFPEIKSVYNETIHKAHISEKGGAGLGLLKILRSSRLPMKYKTTNIDDKCSFITITITIADTK